MGTPPQLTHLAFASTLDESQEGELLDPLSAFPVLANGRQDKRGGYGKRLGYKLFASDGLLATARRRLDSANWNAPIPFTTRIAGCRLFMSGDAPCVIDGTYLDAFSPAVDSWVNKGRVSEATYRLLRAPSLGAEHPVEDIVVANGVTIVAQTFFDSSGGTTLGSSVVTVTDAEDSTVIRPLEVVDGSASGSGIYTRLAVYSGFVVLFVFDSDAVEIRAWWLDAGSRTTIADGWTSLGVIASDWDPDNIDVASFGSRVAVAYGNDSGGSSRLTVKTLDSGGVIDTVTIDTSSHAPKGISLSEDSTTLWVAWAEELGGSPIVTNHQVIGLNPVSISGTPLATQATVITTSRVGFGAGRTWVVDTGSGTGKLYIINKGVFQNDNTAFRSFSTSGGAVVPDAGSASGYRLQNSTPAGRPMYRNGRVYIPMTTTNYEEVVICDCTDQQPNWRPVVVPVQRGIYNMLTSGAQVRIAAINSDKYVWSFNVLKAGGIFGGINGTALVELNFADPERWRIAQLGKATFIGGGFTGQFDGRRCAEAGFLSRPPPATLNTASSGGQTFSVGRSYVVTYEEVDFNGDWHVSGVSDPVSTGAITSKSVGVKVYPLSITARVIDPVAPFGSAVRISIWGTTDGGSTYYRMTSLENNPGSESISWTDTLAEADFTSNALLYATGNLPGTNGSSQDHRAPPGLKYVVSYAGMIVGAIGNAIYFSSQPIDGEGTWFSPVFVQFIDDEITGLTVQDGGVIAFTRTGAWIGAGEPPSDNASAGGMGTFRKVAIDVGCIDSNSIVTTSFGTFFQSDRGIELLTRGNSLVWIGEKVLGTLADFPIVSSAVLDAKEGLVRISLAESRSSGIVSGEGRDIVFDLALQGWISVDDKRGQSASEASQDGAMMLIDGVRRYAWLAADGAVYIEHLASDSDAHLDGSSWITQAAETSWFKVAGLQGKQQLNQVLALLRKQTDLNLSISISYNYETSFRTANTWTRTQINDLLSGGWPITQLRHDPHNDAECQSFRLRIEDATPTGGTVGSGRGATWLGLTLDIIPKQGTFDVPEEAA